MRSLWLLVRDVRILFFPPSFHIGAFLLVFCVCLVVGFFFFFLDLFLWPFQSMVLTVSSSYCHDILLFINHWRDSQYSLNIIIVSFLWLFNSNLHIIITTPFKVRQKSWSSHLTVSLNMLIRLRMSPFFSFIISQCIFGTVCVYGFYDISQLLMRRAQLGAGKISCHLCNHPRVNSKL